MTGSRRSLGSRFAVLLLVLAAIPIAAQLLEAMPSADPFDLSAPPRPPRLWDSEPAQCPTAVSAAAVELGRQRALLARDKSARRSFCPADGIAAASLHEQAAACFRQAGEAEQAAAQSAHASALRDELGRAFRTHQLRLEHALRSEDWAIARRQVRHLRGFVRERPGEYLSWLDRLAHEVAVDEGSDE
jgi:hypothetical protein